MRGTSSPRWWWKPSAVTPAPRWRCTPAPSWTRRTGASRSALAALLPGLTPLSIRIRLTAIIAVAMAMLPRSTGHRLLALQQGGVRPDDAEIARETRALSLLAWLAEPECS